jgi:hypothetical protein
MSEDLKPFLNPHPVCNIICALNEKCMDAGRRQDFFEAQRLAVISTELSQAVAKAWNEVGEAIVREARDVGPEIERLREEIEVLRNYGNKDCTGMADEALARIRAEREAGKAGK